MNTRIAASALVMLVLTFRAKADPYLLPHEVTQALNAACEEVVSSVGSTDRAIPRIDQKSLSQSKLLSELVKLYRPAFTEAEMSEPVNETVLNRILSCTFWDKPRERCSQLREASTESGMPPREPILVNHPAEYIQIRNALLGLIEFGRTDAPPNSVLGENTLAFRIARYQLNDEENFTLGSQTTDTRQFEATPSPDDAALIQLKSNPIAIECTGTSEPAPATPSGDMLTALDHTLVRTASWVDALAPWADTEGVKGNAQPSPYQLLERNEPFSLKVLLAKDATQFFPKVGTPAEIGWSLEGETTDDLEIDAALGVTASRIDPATKKTICNKRLCSPGNARAYTAYIA